MQKKSGPSKIEFKKPKTLLQLAFQLKRPLMMSLLLGKAVEQQETLIKELMLGNEIDRDSLIARLTLVRGTMSMASICK